MSYLFCGMAKSKKYETPVKTVAVLSEKERLKIIGERIRQQRKANGYSSAFKFAIDSGFEPSRINRFENGYNLTVSTLFKVADALKISVSELLKDL
jgi:hypothetical protein